MIGARIRLAREVCEITQEELGELIGTTQSGVASLEAGLYLPSEQFLKTIAVKTGFEASFFTKGELPEFPYGSLLYRAKASIKQGFRTKARAIAQVAYELLTTLNAPWKNIPINIPRLSGEDAITCAQIARTTFGYSPDTPIKDLLLRLEKNGAMVLSIPMDVDGFDGFSAWTAAEPSRPTIALLRPKPGYRQGFTVAEEFGHLIMHSPLRVSAVEADREARAFAQEFLLPAQAMREEMPQPVTLSSLAPLKHRWGASMKFLVKRAATLAIINSNQYRYLCQQMMSKWGNLEPGDDTIIPDRPKIARKLAEMTYGNPIDLPRLRKDTGLPIGLVRNLLGIEGSKVLEFKLPSEGN